LCQKYQYLSLSFSITYDYGGSWIFQKIEFDSNNWIFIFLGMVIIRALFLDKSLIFVCSSGEIYFFPSLFST